MNKTLRQLQHEQLLQQLRQQGAIATDIPQLWPQEGEGETGTDPSPAAGGESAAGESPSPSPSPSPESTDDLTGLKNSLAAARRERDEAIRKLNAAQSELTSAQQSLTETQGTFSALESERDALKIDFALSNELRDVDPSKRDLLWNTARSQVGLVDGEVKAGDRPLPEFVSGLRTQYPDMFLAPNVPTGTGTAPSTPSTPAAPAIVAAPGGIITGTDPADIISGKVKIST